MNSPIVSETILHGVLRVEERPVRDDRGWFVRRLSPDLLDGHGIDLSTFGWHLASLSLEGVVRGLHTRISPGESKIISCRRGRVADVLIDLRPFSATFLQHQWFDLREDDFVSIVVPPGIAHGFQAISDTAEMSYLIDRAHAPAEERAVHFADPVLNLTWPIDATVVSARDRDAPTLVEVQDELSQWFPEEERCAQ